MLGCMLRKKVGSSRPSGGWRATQASHLGSFACLFIFSPVLQAPPDIFLQLFKTQLCVSECRGRHTAGCPLPPLVPTARAPGRPAHRHPQQGSASLCSWSGHSQPSGVQSPMLPNSSASQAPAGTVRLRSESPMPSSSTEAQSAPWPSHEPLGPSTPLRINGALADECRPWLSAASMWSL